MDKLNKGSVIIVEDDMLLSLVQGRIVNKLGYDVVAKAVDGADAIQKVKAYNPDILLMDISIKGSIDGIETVAEIRKFSDVPVIYLSGSSDKISVERARKTGFSDFLIKPVSIEDMSEPLAKAMSERESKRLSQAS